MEKAGKERLRWKRRKCKGDREGYIQMENAGNGRLRWKREGKEKARRTMEEKVQQEEKGGGWKGRLRKMEERHRK